MPYTPLKDERYENVPFFLGEMRRAVGVSQRQLGNELGKTSSWVYQSEMGIRRVDIFEFINWCKALKISAIQSIAELSELRERNMR